MEKVVLVFIILFSCGCSTIEKQSDLIGESLSWAGDYSYGAMTSVGSLKLKEGGRFVARFSSCYPVPSVLTGTWVEESDHVELIPNNTTSEWAPVIERCEKVTIGKDRFLVPTCNAGLSSEPEYLVLVAFFSGSKKRKDELLGSMWGGN